MSRHDHYFRVSSAQAAGLAALRLRLMSQAALVAFLAVSAAACAAGGNDGQAGSGPVKPRLPVPTDFRARVAELVAGGRLRDAAVLLNNASPELHARAASEKADIVYWVIMGIGPITPGIEPRPKPTRTWIVPGTSDIRQGPDDEAYQLAAYTFAKAYNAALAKEERGVR